MRKNIRSSSRQSTLATSLLAAFSVFSHSVSALNAVQSPNLDLSQLGRVAVAGDFDAISIYQYTQQAQSSFNTNGSQALLSRLPSGAFTALDKTDAYIETMCPFVLKDGTLAGVVIGGNFTSLDDTPAQAVALFNPNTSAITPLPGISGRVSALYCDASSGTVYVGGSFSGGNSTNAIAWTTGWTNLPFAGFNGPVTSITKGANGTIIFGGSFTGLGNNTTPQTRDGQVINIGSSNVSAVGTTTQAGFSDPRNIVCKTGQGGAGNTWLLADNTPGSLTASFGFGFVPTKLRLYNAIQDGRGTRTWRFTALPLDGILNMTYTDPTTGAQQYCDARCPLPQNNNTYQDFHFVNNVGMNSFRIDISDWYGAGGGLGGIQLFEDDIYSYAIEDYNEPSCAVSQPSRATTTGPWRVSPSLNSSSEYLTASLTGSPVNPAEAQVVFSPDIVQSGNYSVTVYTPGCRQDNTCDTRGRVNITGVMGTPTDGASVPLSTELFQTNYFDKYDQVYFGYVDATNGSFRPSVTLTPSAGQNGPLTVVAQRVRFELRSSSGGLQGLYEYNPNQLQTTNDFSTSAVDRAGMSLSTGAQINALATVGNTLYAAGDFNGTDFGNVLSVSSQTNSLPENGLNGPVASMYQNGSGLYMGGSFTGTRSNATKGLQGVALFNTSTNTWAGLGNGVNGVVNYVIPFNLNTSASGVSELALALSGRFAEVNAFGSNSSFAANNFAVWMPARGNWLHNLRLNTISLSGVLTATTQVPGYAPLFGGNIASQGSGASGAVELTQDGNNVALQQFPVQVDAPTASFTNSSSSLLPSSGVIAGLLYEESNLNLTVLAGHFQTQATNGTTINNLAIINGSNSDTVGGITAGIDSRSVFAAVGTQGTQLFAGGQVSGNVNGNNVNGLVIYDLVRNNYNATQPPALSGSNVVVNAIAPQPNAKAVFVGGSFDGAGQFTCPALCLYDTDRAQWNSPGNGLNGNVTALNWVGDTKLIVGGSLTVNGGAAAVATYDSKAQTFTPLTGANAPTGRVTALTPASSDGNQVWAAGQASDGSSFLSKWNGSSWAPITGVLGAGSTIRGLQVFTLTDVHPDTQTVPNTNALMVLGSLNVPGFGNASAALFNGTNMTPFLLANNANGGSGSLSQVFVQNPQNFFKTGTNHLAVGFVILIALAIALALIFLLVLAGIIAERYRRKRDGYIPAPTQQMTERQTSNMGRLPPEQLFGSVGGVGGNRL